MSNPVFSGFEISPLLGINTILNTTTNILHNYNIQLESTQISSVNKEINYP